MVYLNTQMESYEKLKADGIRSKRYCQIHNLLMEYKGGLTNRVISEMLHLPINCVTGRVKEMRELGILEIVGERYDQETRRRVKAFGIRREILNER